jgi:chromate reductase
VRVLALSGSLRRGSYNGSLLQAAAELSGAGDVFVLWDELADVPAYSEDLDEAVSPPAVASLKHEIARADAVLISTPEYNSSIPGALKNALDWTSRPFASSPIRNKPVAVIGASSGMFGAVWAQAELRKVLAAMGARVVEVELAVGLAADRFDADGDLLDEGVRDQLRETLRVLKGAAESRLATAAPSSALAG